MVPDWRGLARGLLLRDRGPWGDPGRGLHLSRLQDRYCWSLDR